MYEKFCKDTRTKGEKIVSNLPDGSSANISDDVDWSLYPFNNKEYKSIVIHATFFRVSDKADEFIRQDGCTECFGKGDMQMTLIGDAAKKKLETWFDKGSRAISTAIRLKTLRPDLHTKELISIPDF